MTYQFTHDGVTVNVHPARDEKPLILFVNGIFGGGWVWEPVVAGLQAYGFGAAYITEPLAQYRSVETVPTLVASLAMLADLLPDPRPVLCGNSLGALAAVELVAAKPQRWSGLILTGPAGLGDDQSNDGDVRSALRSPNLRMGHVLADRIIHQKHLITPELIKRTTEDLNTRSIIRAARALRATKGWDVQPFLPRIPIPTLLLCGEFDRVSPAALWSEAAQLLPQGTFVQIQNSGHSPMIEEPEQFMAALLPWLDCKVPTPTYDAQP